MKPDPRQLSLFPRRGLPATTPFSLEPSPEEIRICSACGGQIIVRRRTRDGRIESQFHDALGRCLECNRTARPPKGR
jgi:hypothetical protein